MQGLRAAHHRRQGLYGGAYDVVVRLLRGKRAASRLRMKAQGGGAGEFRAETLRHCLVPDAARGAVFGDFLKKIVVGIEEKRKGRREVVHGHASTNSPFDVLDSITQREGQFLYGRRSRLANVVAADRYWIEPWGVSRAEFQRVDHQ